MDLHASGSQITFIFKSIAESVSEGSHLIVRSQHEESKIPIVSVERNPSVSDIRRLYPTGEKHESDLFHASILRIRPRFCDRPPIKPVWDAAMQFGPIRRGSDMSNKQYCPEEIIGNLQSSDVLNNRGKEMVDVIMKNSWCRRRGSNPHDLAATGS